MAACFSNTDQLALISKGTWGLWVPLDSVLGLHNLQAPADTLQLQQPFSLSLGFACECQFFTVTPGISLAG